MEWLDMDRIWLSQNVTRDQVDKTPFYPRPKDLVYSIPIALALVLVRSLLMRLVFSPIALHFGIKCKPVKPVSPQPVLEAAFRSKGTKKYENLASEIRWTVREVEIWFRQRKRMNTCTQMKKFNESAWRLLYYVCAVVGGVSCFYKEPWLLYPSLFFAKSPLETELTPKMWWYYILQLGYCVSMMINHLYETKRKDFLMMFVHHIYYFLLMYISWCSNAIYVGIAVLFVHDISDVPLEVTKCSIYLNLKKTQSVAFMIFGLAWIVLRLICLPYIIFMFYKTAYPYMAILPYVFIVIFLIGLQILHVIWSKMILDMFLASLRTNELSDVRSESEGATSSEDEKTK